MAETCGYCYTPADDLRQLPCRHAACLDCLQNDFRNLNKTECPTCRMYEALDFSSLTIVDSGDTAAVQEEIVIVSESDDKLVCDVCKHQGGKDKAIAYCIDCEVKACDEHITQDHPREDTDNHATVEYETYLSRPDVHKAFRCSKHNKRITKICYTCDELGCDCCEEEKGCKKTSFFSEEVDYVDHLYVQVSVKVERARSSLEEKGCVIAEKLTKINETWKDVWPRLDLLEASCESLKEEIKRKVSRKSLQNELKGQVEKYLKEKTDLVEVFSQQLMSKKETLEELQSVIHRFLTTTHEIDIIREQEKTIETVDATLAIRIAYCEWKNPILLDSKDTGSYSSEFEIGFGIPFALTLSATHPIGRHCYSVCYKPDGELVVGRDFTVRLYNRQHEVVRDVDSKYPTSAVAANGKIYFTNSWNYGRVVVQTEQLDDPDNMLHAGKELYEFSRGYTFNQMDVSEKWSVLVNGETSQIIIYNMLTDVKTYLDLDDTPNYVHFHSDGDLLLTFSSVGKLVKYRISPSGKPTPLWTCYLDNPCGVCTDEMGLIFVRSGGRGHSGDSGGYGFMGTGAIYVVTKEGKRVKTFSDTGIYPTPGGMSIYGDTLAVAGWNEECYQLYKMTY